MTEMWHLSAINWLTELSSDNLEKLRRAATVFRVGSQELVFEPNPQPQYVFILESGLVRMYRTCGHGEEVTFGYIHPGEVFGELAIFVDKPRESYAIAMERSAVIRIERDVFSDVLREHPSIVFSVATQMGSRFKKIESRVEDLVFCDARARLARIIIDLAEEFGVQADGGVLIDVRLTHAELATLVGSSRPTVSIALGELEDEDALTRLAGKILLTNRELLIQESNRTG